MYRISQSLCTSVVRRPVHFVVGYTRPKFYVCRLGCVNSKQTYHNDTETTTNITNGHNSAVCTANSNRNPSIAFHRSDIRQLWCKYINNRNFVSCTHVRCYHGPAFHHQYRLFHSSCRYLGESKEKLNLKLIDELQDEKSKVEEYVEHQKKKLEKKEKIKASSKDYQKAFIFKMKPLDDTPPAQEPAKPIVIAPKKPIMLKVKEIALHYYNGFKLLYLDTKIAARLLGRVVQGKDLTRRERKQLLRTASDLFRLVPFTVFLVVPFMEFLLPVAIRLFPNLLPSTFEDKKAKENKRKGSLKLKLQMAEFIQDTIEEIAVTDKGKKKQNKKLVEFAEFVDRTRGEVDPPTNAELLKYSKLFEDDITLENIPIEQLQALARIMMVSSTADLFGRDFLIIRIRAKLRVLKSDDEVIKREGIENLSNEELQNACIQRGIRAFGVPIERLQSNLRQWLELSLDREIPVSLLLLSRTFYLPQDEHLDEQLKSTIRQLPERLIDEVEVKIGAEEGEQVDKQTMLDILQHEEEQIKFEKEQRVKIREEEEKMKTNILVDSTTKQDEQQFSKEEILQVKETLEVSSVKEKLHEIKAEREEYIEDVQELQQVKKQARESVAGVRLGKRLDAILKRVEKRLEKVEKSALPLEKIVDQDDDGIVTTDELLEAMQRLPNAPSLERMQSLIELMDEDKDGIIDLEEMKNAIRILDNENYLTQVTVKEVLSLLKGLERIYINDQIIHRRKSNYFILLIPSVYGRASIDNFPHL